MRCSQEFGEKLRQLRTESKLSLRGLADATEVSFSYLCKIETGALPPPSERLITKLSTTLNADKEELMVLAGRLPSYVREELRKRGISEFGPRIRELRTRAGMSQSGLAAKADIDPTYLSKIESGTKHPPSRKIILRLACALNVDGKELLALAGRIPPNGNIKASGHLRRISMARHK